MQQPQEVLKFSYLGRNAAKQTEESLQRVAAHVNRAFGSYKKAVTHPLSEQAAKAVVEVENTLSRLRAALDAAAVCLDADYEYYTTRIIEAEAALNVTPSITDRAIR